MKLMVRKVHYEVDIEMFLPGGESQLRGFCYKLHFKAEVCCKSLCTG